MQSNAMAPAAVDETDRLIGSDKIGGAAVFNDAGDSLGSINAVMIDKRSGQIEYAVLSLGGFLGVGSKYYPVPWKALEYEWQIGGYFVDLDKSRLVDAPSYEGNDTPDWNDPNFGRQIDDFYGPFP